MASGALLWEPGLRVWLGLKGQWLPAWVSQITSSEVTFTSQYNGDTYPLPRASLTSDYVMPMHQSSIDTVEDMANLGDLHEASILFNIQQRYLKDYIYSYIGSILCAVNPYKTIENAYSLELMQAYKDKQLGQMPPHIYAISNEIYVSLWRMRQNQCALISGESGAGKTESTKFILSYLSCMSQQAVGAASSDISVESAILESSPILEAFGNAKTVYNNNSSRFGKFIRLEFSEMGNITGGKIIDYLLEKNRVVRQNPMERNYHIFYCLVAGLSPQEKESLQLSEPQAYHYLNQSGCVSDPTIDDVSDFARVRHAFDVMGLAPEQVADVFMVLSGVLHLGNVTFVSAAGAQIAEKPVLESTAGLLSLDPFRLGDALTQKYMVLRGEEITTPLTVQQAEDSRDSTAMSLYASLFRWILQRINVRLKGKEAFAFIGILDIFGFENFDVNRFEQFNINFANEKLQEYFNKHIFSLEQHEYSKEGIDWADIEWVDNAECLDLVERKLGVLDLMDEESRFPKGTDKSLLEKLHGNHKDNPYYVKPKVNNAKFGIRHYAGEVFYDTKGLLEKNRDTFRDDILKVLKDSRSDFVYDLFEHLTPGEASGGGGKAGKGMGRQPTVRKRGGRSSRKRATVSSQFKESLHSLMSTLGQANPYFIRCIKPNSEKAPNYFMPDMVLNQLKYSGMMETVRIRRSGYPVRREFKDFLFRYGVLGREVRRGLDERETCVAILMQYDATNKDWQLGKTKVFYRENLERAIERTRDMQLRAVCRVIYSVVCTVIARRRYLKTRANIIIVQKMIKRFLCVRRFIRTRKAVICMQRFERGRQARKLYAQLLEQKRIEEERRREEQRRREEERQRELERQQRELEKLEREKREAEASEMRRKLEEEEARRQREEEARLRAEEEERLATLAKIRELEEEHQRLEEERRLRAEAQAAAQRAEEEARRREKEAAKVQGEVEEAYEMLGSLDNALKAFTGRFGLEEGEQGEMESDTEEDELESGFEEMKSDEESEETQDPHSSKFRATGQLLLQYEEEPSFEGYLMFKGGKRQGWTRRWAIIKDDALMFFEMKQDAIKQGWLLKKSSGTGTLGRRNWKRRYFALRGKTIYYYSESDLSQAKPQGAIDLKDVTGIIEEGGTREHAFGLVTSERTFHLTAETAIDKKEWVEVIRRVRTMPEQKVKSMLAQEVDPRKALLTLDLELIESVTATDQERRPNAFAVITPSRVFNLISESSAEMHMWIGALSPRKFTLGEDDLLQNARAKGWLIKESKMRRKRYFVLTDNNQLRYYRTEDTRQPVSGNIHLNSLCAVDVNEENETVEGPLTFSLHARKTTLKLTAKNAEEADEWIVALQDAIDSCPPIQTVTERLVLEMIKNAHQPDWERIYKAHKILCRIGNPIKAPLLALPYGKPPLPPEKEVVYGTRHAEAVKIFNSLLSQDSLADPIKQVQEILQKCFDMEDLQSEVFCQLIKQTAGVPQEEVDTPGVLSIWQTLSCMTCTFIPERAIKRYLTMHIKKVIELHPDTEMAKYATFCQTSLKRTRRRDFAPSRSEVIACLGRRDMNTVVFSYGDAQCQININSSTTAGEVVKTLTLGLKVSTENNRFALFEQCGRQSKVIDDRTILPDILGKFEGYYREDLTRMKPGDPMPQKWKLFFKFFCYFKPHSVPSDSIESVFLYEQFCDDVVMGKFPVSQEKLLKLAALRLQYLDGDCTPGSTIQDVTEVYPLSRIEQEVREQKDMFGSLDLHETYYKDTLRHSKGIGTLTKKTKAPQITEEDKLRASIEVKKNAIKVSVADLWRRLEGTTANQVQQKYLEILSECASFGSTFFEAEYTNRDQRFPKELWLVVNCKGVQIYQRGAVAPIQSYLYGNIVSFGAPVPNEYKLIVEGQAPISIHTSQVAEIAKLMKAYIQAVVGHIY